MSKQRKISNPMTANFINKGQVQHC